MCLCTDDRNPLDIAEEGHLDHMIRRLIALGSPPLAVYRAASLSAAEAFGLKDRGLIAPGKRADIVAVGDLGSCDVQAVWAGGVAVTDAAFAARSTIPPVGRHSVKAPVVTADSFRTPANREATDVIGILEGKIITEHLREHIPVQDGDKRPDPARDLVRIAVVERHGRNGNIATGFVKGFGLRSGAIASTVCHDHHNIACVGVDYADMALAANRLSEIEGGFVVAQGGEVLAELALPVAGLMSLGRFEEVHDGLKALRAAAKSLGVTLHEPFLQTGLPGTSGHPGAQDHRPGHGRRHAVRDHSLNATRGIASKRPTPIRPLWHLVRWTRQSLCTMAYQTQPRADR